MLTVLYKHCSSGEKVLHFRGPSWLWDDLYQRIGSHITVLSER